MRKSLPLQSIEKHLTDNFAPKNIFSNCGIKNAGCSCYLNCFLQIISNYSNIFQQIQGFQPQKELETHLYAIIQKLLQSEEPISTNFFLNDIRRDLHINTGRQQNFFDILNNLCRKIPIVANLFKLDLDTSYLNKNSKEIIQYTSEERFYFINFTDDKKKKSPNCQKYFKLKML